MTLREGEGGFSSPPSPTRYKVLVNLLMDGHHLPLFFFFLAQMDRQTQQRMSN